MSNASTLALFARLLVSLAVVIGLMWGASAVLRRRGIGTSSTRRSGSGLQVELLARRSMGRNVSIAVVKVADQAMVVGITDHQVTTLAHAELEELDITTPGVTPIALGAQRTAVPTGSTAPPTTWKAMLEQLRDRTVRH
jgi:flagellar protein FliO/FliZ